MNKYIFTAIALAAAVISCTKSDLVDAPEAYQTPISFETYTGKTPITKASSETKETLQTYTDLSSPAFHVTAFNPGDYTATSVYMDKNVWYETSTSKWQYEGTAYWPSSGVLDFVAYGYNAADHLSPVSDSKTEFTYTVDSKPSAQEDLIVAKSISSTYSATGDEPGTVSLVFSHLLSKVGFTLQTTKASTEALPINVKIKHVELLGTFYPTGNVDLVEGTLEIPDGATASVTSYSLFDTSYPMAEGQTSYDYFGVASPGPDGTGIFANSTFTVGTDGNTDAPKTGASENNRYMMLIPGGKVTGAKVTYQIDNSDEVDAVATLDAATTLVQGTAYEFIIRLSTEAIEFSGAIVGWEPAETPIP